ncbi:MAG: hypothetical protein KF861_20300 [Planctomycetaceae bacterium]|nr:hypothetical protein [Planctomycetaceae bacterium]
MARATINGRVVVAAMFAFGIVMTTALFVYWDLYTRPFRPLQAAINAAYPGSLPRVIGGEHKSHKHQNPATLRIVIRVDFNPLAADAHEVEPYTSRLLDLAAEHLDLSPYEQVEIHLVHRVPDGETQQQVYLFPRDALTGRTTSAFTTTSPGDGDD